MKMKNKKVKAIGIVLVAIMLISVFVAIAPAVSATEAGDLEEIRKAIEESGAEWQADYTSVSGLSLEEKQQLCGLKIRESMKNMIESTSSVQRSIYDENAMKNMIESTSSVPCSRYDESATNEMGIASIDTTVEVPKTSSLAGYNIAVVNAGGYPSNLRDQLVAWGATVDLINVPDITASLLSSYDLVWLPCGAAGAVDAGGKAAAILSYVQNGGGEILAQPNEVMTPQCLPYTWQIVGDWWEEPPCAATIVDPTHELTAGLTVNDMPDCFDDVGTVAPEYTILARSGAGDASFACANYGTGRVIVEMDAPLGPGICDVCDDCPSLSEAMVTRMVEWVSVSQPCDAFDWRDYLGGDWTTSIRDQGPCGSCWAFGSQAAMEAHINIQNNDPTFDQDLSEQQLLSCSPGDCNGWYEDAVLNWLRDEGTVDEACFPYQADDTIPCSDHCPNWESRIWKITDWGWVAPTIDDIKGHLHDAPLVTGMAVYEDFLYYDGGIYEHVWGDLLGYHLVSMVGYDECEDYWISKNSWGPGWGEAGWFRIRYGQCFIEDMNAYIEPPIIEPQPAQPDIWVDPTSFDVTLPPDTIQDYTLIIGNDGEATLTYDISDVETTTTTTVTVKSTSSVPCSRYDEKATNEMGIASIDTTVEVPKTSSLAGYNIAVVNAGGYPSNLRDQLVAWGATVDLINVPDITASLLSSYDLVWIPCCGAAGAVDAGGKAAEILSYVQNGGGEILTQPNEVMTPQCLPYTWQIVGDWWEEPPCAATIVDPTHELTAGLTVNDMPDCFDDVGTVAPEYTILARSGAGDASFACANYGNGRVIVEMDAPLGPGICDVCDDCPSLSEAMVTRMVEWVSAEVKDCPWLDENPKSGSVPPGEHDAITVTIDTTGLAAGEYSANIIIANNDPDPDENPTIVPVSLRVGKPDLVVEKSVTIEDCNFIVNYTVTNIGDGPAGASTTCKLVDGTIKETQICPALGPGASYSSTFDPEPCTCGEILNVTVCADNNNEVDESNETNNCEVNFVECPPCLPDLVITNIWTVGNTIHYTIKNKGCIPAPTSDSGLYIDGIYRARDRVPALDPGEDSDEVFARYNYKGGLIEVCADYQDRIEEINEDNNCRGPSAKKPDLVIEDKWEEWINATHYTVTYVIHNKGTAVAPACHNTTLYVDGVEIEHKHVPVALAPCETYTDTFDTVIECTPPFDTIRVCADNFNVVDELDETNNCMENEWSCVKKPDLVITEKYETFVDGGHINITYKVNNRGGADAGPSSTTIYIDGDNVLEVPTPAIPEGECHENTVGPFECPCGETLNVTVCADNKDEVDESDETNNCAVNFVKCPPCLPDLVITNCEPVGNRIHYTIENQGGADAPTSYTGLWVDGGYSARDKVEPLGIGATSNEVFERYNYRGGEIEVCADYQDRIAEIDETNNCCNWP